MILLLLSGCLYNQDYLHWVYTQLEDDDGDGFREIDEDCNDHNPEIHPGAYEVCDGVDNDCNGELDSDALDIRPWYQDRDQDGYGLDAVMRLSCEPVPTYASEGGDCDDEDATIHPDAEVVCGEAIDRNCDGSPENLDQDQDGFPKCAECSDLDPRVHPGATERCNDLDDDCNGVVDGPDADERLWYPDDDGDGYGDKNMELLSCDPPENYIVQGGDCDETDPLIHPGATEICSSGVDEDCDGTSNACAWSGELTSGASLIGTTDVGMGRDSVLKGMINAGDMDGNGHEELAFANNGRVIVWHGPFVGSNQPVTSGYFVSVKSPSAGLGLVISALGDVDGDGREDLGLADPFLGDGVVYLLRTESGDVDADELWTLDTPDPTYSFGLGMASNEETLFVSTGDLQTNRSTLFSTALPLTNGVDPVWKTVLRNDNGIAGMAMNFMDVNGDGIQDLGTPRVNFSSSGLATVPDYGIYLGPLTQNELGDPDIVLTSSAGFAFAADSGPPPGDVTGDGLDDVWLLHAEDNHAKDAGVLWLVKPDHSGDAEALSVATIIGDPIDDAFSRFIASDLNQDLQSDLLLGLRNSDSEPLLYDGAGRIQILYGPFQGTVDSTQYNAHYEGTPYSWTGQWLALGAFNHAQDLAICAPGDEGSNNEDSRVDFIWDPL